MADATQSPSGTMTTITFVIAPHDVAVAAAVIALVVLAIIRWRRGLGRRTWLPLSTCRGRELAQVKLHARRPGAGRPRPRADGSARRPRGPPGRASPAAARGAGDRGCRTP